MLSRQLRFPTFLSTECGAELTKSKGDTFYPKLNSVYARDLTRKAFAKKREKGKWVQIAYAARLMQLTIFNKSDAVWSFLLMPKCLHYASKHACSSAYQREDRHQSEAGERPTDPPPPVSPSVALHYHWEPHSCRQWERYYHPKHYQHLFPDRD